MARCAAQRLFQSPVDEVRRLERLDGGRGRRRGGDVREKRLERRRAGARIHVPSAVQRGRPDLPEADVVDEGRDGIGQQDLQIGVTPRRIGGRRAKRLDGGQMIVARNETVLLDVANGLQDLVGPGPLPRGSEIPGLEEVRDRVRLQQAHAANGPALVLVQLLDARAQRLGWRLRLRRGEADDEHEDRRASICAATGSPRSRSSWP